MDYVQVIKDNFNKGYFNKAMEISGLPNNYPAWTIKQNGWYGVAVECDSVVFSERFSKARIWTEKDVEIGGVKRSLLILSCSDPELRNEFATICSQFVQPGINGESRQQLILSPDIWWKNWKALLGNRESTAEVYMKIGELLVVEELLKKGYKPKWTGVENATHDIELDDRSYEVKSTISRYGYEVEISSIYQLESSGSPLSLAFLRFEKSAQGRSLDEVLNSLVQLGYPADELDDAMNRSGLEKGCMARTIKYKLLETKVCPVDENFPLLKIDSFVGGVLPPNVVKVKYTVDLAGVSGSATV